MLQKNCFIPKRAEICGCLGNITWIKEKYYIFKISIKKDTNLQVNQKVMHQRNLATSISIWLKNIFTTMKFLLCHWTTVFSKKVVTNYPNYP